MPLQSCCRRWGGGCQQNRPRAVRALLRTLWHGRMVREEMETVTISRQGDPPGSRAMLPCFAAHGPPLPAPLPPATTMCGAWSCPRQNTRGRRGRCCHRRLRSASTSGDSPGSGSGCGASSSAVPSSAVPFSDLPQRARISKCQPSPPPPAAHVQQQRRLTL